MKKVKILLVYLEEEKPSIESVWALKEGPYYRIDNIPFFASNIALGDLISVEKDEDGLYFKDLIQESGNSVIQIIFFDLEKTDSTIKNLENLGCSWEGSHLPMLFSVNIPKNLDYRSIIKELEGKVKKGILSYKESCLAHN